jgi:hypothetical protein
MSAVYAWAGLGWGAIGVLLAVIMLVQGPTDVGSVAFGIVLGLFTGSVAASSGYALLKDPRGAPSGCLVIVLITGGLAFLTGALLYALSIDSKEPPPPAMIAIVLALGAVLAIPSGVLLWRQLRTRQ